jgi:integrase
MASIFKTANGWRAMVRRKGQKAQSEYFDTKQDAERWARSKEVGLDNGIVQAANPGRTWREMKVVFDKFSPPVDAQQARNHKRLEKSIGHWRMDVKWPQILAYVTLRERKKILPSTINNDLQTIRGLVRKAAIYEGNVQSVMPFLEEMKLAIMNLTAMGRISETRKRERRIEEAEVKKLLEYWHQHPNQKAAPILPDIVQFAIATGMRRAEICRLKRSDLDTAKRMIWVRDRKDPKKKKGNHQFVPLLKGPYKFEGVAIDPMAILSRQKVDPANPDLFFPFHPDFLTHSVHNAAEGANITDLRFHDLRHEGISRMFEFGYAIPEVALVSGHNSWKMLQRYTKLNPVDLHKRADLAAE